MIETLYSELADIAKKGFSDIVEFTRILNGKLRIFLKDQSFLDIWVSRSVKGRYAFHLERRHIDGTIYRHDNIPHKAWKHVKTFPRHFHYMEEKNVVESDINPDPKEALRDFLRFVIENLVKEGEA
jgi:hypothetical protein